jgi:hypothetical protein
MPAPVRRRILGMDRDTAFWVFAILVLIALGVLLDVFWGAF